MRVKDSLCSGTRQKSVWPPWGRDVLVDLLSQLLVTTLAFRIRDLPELKGSFK